MADDIRKILQMAKGPGLDIDLAIAKVLGTSTEPEFIEPYSTNYTDAIEFIERRTYDWVMNNVNGQAGGTPFVYVGVTEDKASFSATPLSYHFGLATFDQR